VDVGKAKHDVYIGALEGVRVSEFWELLYVNLFDKFTNRKDRKPQSVNILLRSMLLVII